MKHIFIINPRAGRKNGAAHLMDQIEALRRVHNLTCETVLTGRQGHAEEVARRAAESGEAVRLYACGGDGTLNEVLNGAAGADRAEITVVPTGTGNDFLKNYGEDAVRFEDLEQLWNGPGHDLDLIECGGRLAATIACVGLDARVADDVHRFSKVLPVSGKMAYLVSAGANFCKSTGQRMMITCGAQATIGEYAMVCVCNGRYYGGGSMPVPEARMDDGVLETILVKNVPKRTFARLFPAYSAGEYWKFPHIARMVTSRQVVITASPGEADIVTCLDGESLRSREVRLVLAEKRVNFFGPKGCSATAGFDRKPRKRRYSTAFLLL